MQHHGSGYGPQPTYALVTPDATLRPLMTASPESRVEVEVPVAEDGRVRGRTRGIIRSTTTGLGGLATSRRAVGPEANGGASAPEPSTEGKEVQEEEKQEEDADKEQKHGPQGHLTPFFSAGPDRLENRLPTPPLGVVPTNQAIGWNRNRNRNGSLSPEGHAPRDHEREARGSSGDGDFRRPLSPEGHAPRDHEREARGSSGDGDFRRPLSPGSAAGALHAGAGGMLL